MRVVVNLQASPLADTAASRRTSRTRSTRTSTRSSAGSLDGIGDGWQFGRALNQGELYGIVHAVEGVEFVKILRVYETDLVTGEQQAKPTGSTSCSSPTS